MIYGEHLISFWRTRMKINIEDRYFQEQEISDDRSIYIGLCNIIEKLNITRGSVFDAGCRNGKFLSEFIKNNPSSIIGGCDYFQWAIDACCDSIKPFVYRFDLRDTFEDKTKYDLVICTEVAEHIDPNYCSVFLSNLREKCNGKLIITWSSHGGEQDKGNDPNLQHLNPKTKEEYHAVMKQCGFVFEEELSNRLLIEAYKDRRIPWYMLESIGVFS